MLYASAITKTLMTCIAQWTASVGPALQAAAHATGADRGGGGVQSQRTGGTLVAAVMPLVLCADQRYT